MATFLGILIFLALIAYGHKEYTQYKIGVPVVTTPPGARLALIDFIRKTLPKGEAVLDMGTGWGTTLFQLVKALPTYNVHGIEFSFTPWLVSQFRSFTVKDATNLTLLKGDFFKLDLRPYGLIYCNLPPHIIKILTPKIKRELSAGSYFVCYNTEMDGMQREKAIQINNPRKDILYIYKNTAVRSEHSPSIEQAFANKTSYYNDGKDFPSMLVIGHRGSGKTAPYPEDRPISSELRHFPPENTYESCLKALQEGAAGIEIDVILSQDGELIVCHDDNLSQHMTPTNRQKFGIVFIHNTPYEKLRTLPIGYVGYKLATLDEILSLVVKFNAMINIELKGSQTAAPVIERINEYARTKHLDKNMVLISSFDHGQLKTTRNLDPDIKIGLLFEDRNNHPTALYPDEPGSPYTQHFTIDYVERMYDSLKPFSLHITKGDVNDDLTTAMTRFKLHAFIWSLHEPQPEDNVDLLAMLYHLKQENMPFHFITDFPETVSSLMARRHDEAAQ